MKKIILALSLFLVSSSLLAWTIGPMNYQGRLLDAAGIPQTGTYNCTVNIYDALTNGTLKFSEQQNNIAVTDGVYSFLVSTGVTQSGTWDINLWNTPTLYLEIVVNGQTLTPRHLLAAAPFAFQANLALTTNNALSLGGKSSGAVLQDICVSGKGKWLELVGQCMGIGSSFPMVGGQTTNWQLLTSNSDFRNLDLTNADISGISFSGYCCTYPDFTGTLFKGSTVNLMSFDYTNNMRNTVWDNVSLVQPNPMTAPLEGATFTNMAMDQWWFSSYGPSDQLKNTSFVDLLSCPGALPFSYQCIGYQISYMVWRYMVIGPKINLSETSLMKNRLNSTYITETSLSGASLAEADFSGNTLQSLLFPGAMLSHAKFQRASIRDTYFINNTDLTAAVFDGATIKKSAFKQVTFSTTGTGDLVSFVGADLSYVNFESIQSATTLDFTKATLTDVLIQGTNAPGPTLTFSQSAMTALVLDTPLSGLTVNNSTIVGGISLSSNYTPNINFGCIPSFPYYTCGGSSSASVFMEGNISGNFTGARFGGSKFYNVSFRGANLTGASGLTPANLININWYGATCPNGYVVTALGDTCVGRGI